MKLRLNRRLKFKNISLAIFVITIASGYWYVENFCKVTKVTLRQEFVQLPVLVKQAPAFQVEYLRAANTEGIRRVKDKEKSGFFWTEYNYYVEVATKITNQSEQELKGKVQHRTYTVQEGKINHDIHELRLAPNEYIIIRDELWLPSGEDTKFRSRNGFGLNVDIDSILVSVDKEFCYLVKDSVQTYKGLERIFKSEEPSEFACNRDRLHSFPLTGKINTKKTGLNLRAKAVKSSKDLKDIDILIAMDKGAEVKIMGVSDTPIFLANKFGWWYELEYVDSQSNVYVGYAFSKNIKVNSHPMTAYVENKG